MSNPKGASYPNATIRPLLPLTADDSTVVVLGSQVDGWLKVALKTINRDSLETVQKQEEVLGRVLSSPHAIWRLADIEVPRPKQASLQDSGTYSGGYQTLTIEGRAACVETIHKNQVSFKLTRTSMESLAEYHKTLHCESAADIGPQQEEFLLAIEGFVYQAHASVLERLKTDGSGELPDENKKEVQSSFLSLMKIPPSPFLLNMDPRQTLLHVPPASPNMYTLPAAAPPANIPPGFIGLPQSSQRFTGVLVQLFPHRRI